MAEIEVVIKLDEDRYKSICDGVEAGKRVNVSSLYAHKIIANGTPLPQGHGKLVDVNEVAEYLDNIQLELDGWGETDGAMEIAKARMGLDTVSTIIEANMKEVE